MKSLVEMTDFEINRLVARKLGIGLGLRKVRGEESAVRLKNGIVKDYCNNIADAWPIIESNLIGIEWDCETECDTPTSWCNAFSLLTKHAVMHQSNAARAAMICFLGEE